MKNLSPRVKFKFNPTLAGPTGMNMSVKNNMLHFVYQFIWQR